MALTVKLEATQMAQIAELATSIRELSENLAKWQARQSEIIERGFTDLVAVLGGTDSEALQQRIDELAQRINASSDSVEVALKQSNEGE